MERKPENGQVDIEVTPEMIDAGADELMWFNPELDSGSEFVKRVYLAMTIALALIVAVLYVLFSFLKMGWIADLLPDPVLKGFIEGVVWVTILKQVPGLLGLEGSFEGFFRTLLSSHRHCRRRMSQQRWPV